MKRLILALAAISLPFSASASPELAEQWGVKAGTLYEQSVELMNAVKATGKAELSDAYVTDLSRFAAIASRLGTWNDDVSGSTDLGCIFRGMAEEAEVQLYALEDADTNEASEAALRRLITMFDDAQIIAAAAASSARSDAPKKKRDGLMKPCPANSAFLETLKD